MPDPVAPQPVTVLDTHVWIWALEGDPRRQFLPLSPEIAVESTRLPGEPHGDPADRILMASARDLGGRLATCDRHVIEYARRGQLKVLDGRP